MAEEIERLVPSEVKIEVISEPAALPNQDQSIIPCPEISITTELQDFQLLADHSRIVIEAWTPFPSEEYQFQALHLQ